MQFFLALIVLSLAPSAHAIDTKRKPGESDDCFCQRVHLLPGSKKSCLMVPMVRRLQCAHQLDEIAGMNSHPKKYVLCHLAPKFNVSCRSKLFAKIDTYRDCLGVTEEQETAYDERVEIFRLPEDLREKCRDERKKQRALD